MIPLRRLPAAALTGTPVLILSGAADPIVPAANAIQLAARLTEAGATVRHETLPGGHGLTQADLDVTRAWLETVSR